MSIADIRTGLATALDAVTNLRVSSYYPDDITVPTRGAAGIVDTYRIEFDSALNRGSDEITFDVLIVVDRTSERVAQQTLDTFVPLVKAAIELDSSLAGACDDLHVTAMNGYAPLDNGGTTYLAASFAVRVIATA